MNKFFALLVIASLIAGGRASQRQGSYEKPESLTVVTVENEIITGNTLPRFGVLCEDASVQGNPHDGFETLYILSKGTKVRLRDQGGDGRSWVMIAPAHWIRMSALCEFGK